MSNERILSYNMSQKISAEELENVSAGSYITTHISGTGSYSRPGGPDVQVDTTIDF